MILAGDIGGTKTNLALFDHMNGKPELLVSCQFRSRDFSSLTDVIAEFKHQNPDMHIDAACFGIAGPVIDGRCRTTNLVWDVATAELQTYLETDRVKMLNDLEATAYGMLYLPAEQFVSLNPAAQVRNGNRAVIAAGTGLGEAMLFWNADGYHPIGSEGGHSDFAPMTPQQDELLKWMRCRYGTHVSYERILSGPGVSALYDFLSETGFASEPSAMRNLSANEDKSAKISECALNDHDPLCMQTLRLFTEIYGAEAGNMALKTMSLGGVYVGGGIAPKLLPYLSQYFMDSFVNKGRFAELLRSMDVKVSLNPETALLGAAHYAIDRL